MLFGSLEQPIIQSDTITRGCFMKLTVTRFYFHPILIDGRRWNRVATNFTVSNCFVPRYIYMWMEKRSNDGIFLFTHAPLFFQFVVIFLRERIEQQAFTLGENMMVTRRCVGLYRKKTRDRKN